MKLIVNTETLTHPLRGIGNYTLHLLKGLRQQATPGTVMCFNGSDRLLTIEEVEASLKNAACDADSLICRELICEAPRDAIDARFRELTRSHTDAVYLEPECLNRPFDGRVIPIIYDLSPFRHPEFHRDAYRAMLQTCVPACLERAAHILTVSEFTRSELVSLWGLPRDKITIVPPGVSPEFHPRSPEDVEATRKKYKLPAKYLLAVGTLEPRKNQTNLIAAYSRLSKSLRTHHALVLIGAQGWGAERLEAVIRSYRHPDELFWLGYVEQADLPALYSGAYGFVYASVYEGFGMCLLEAMASGVPVLTSNQSALPEVANKVALLTNPLNLNSLTRNLERLIRDEAFRSNAHLEGPEKTLNYSWDTSAQQVARTLKKMAETH
ncbi:glycosyltransferase family 4 protein [Nitrospina watsonii]|uniref:Glycosyltransferase family 1 protein n=1 Tax=Nitrospina watsonii TaxID=1323948 RepID=A0ABN8VXT2_9BACT|nr:glycosyltransferase family 1 protein [Nitrospina watsonii]CAI2717614.1 putative Glycosyltransferase family 1 protein [Nitrospina watsonii]